MTLLGNLSGMLATIPRGDTGGGFWMPPQASSVAGPVDAIFFLIYWICVFFFVLIVALMVIFVVRYRRQPNKGPEASPSHHTPLELTWTIIPLILVIAIFAVGLKGYVDLTQAPKDSYEVYVTAQKWSWTFEHRNGAVETDQLTVPAGRPVRLIMSSTDVLHSLFIPAFRVKQDCVPGRYTYLWFQSEDLDAERHFQLFCTEYCGTEHSQMGAVVRVMPQEQFDKEIVDLANWIDAYADEDLPKAFRRLYGRCSSCHTLDGTSKIGPSFRETYELWGKERVLADGRSVTVDENYIRSSLLNPGGELVANYPNQMPALGGQLKPRELLAVIEFFKRYEEVVDENGEWISE
jgi:cytochrome c oxidase subunit 2